MFASILIAAPWVILLSMIIGNVVWMCVQEILMNCFGMDETKSRKGATDILIRLGAMTVVIAAFIAKGC